MKLLEYEAKALLKNAGVAIPKSFLAGEKPEFLPAVVKSQVPTGGRGKAGGVVVVSTEEEYHEAADKLVKLKIKGFLPRTLLIEELLPIKNEFYLSLLIDKQAAHITLMANRNGGVEVEENADDSYLRIELRNNLFDEAGQQLADYFDLPEQAFALQELVEKLYKCFVGNDALLLEINPLFFTQDGKLVAGDCKMELDDAAAWRHADWQFEAEKAETNFVTLDQNGTVATVANGAGLAMATVDAVADAGLTPANFLDIGGGANEASVLAAFKRLAGYPNVKVILINIFAGITRCDEVARAIIAARDQSTSQQTSLPPLVIRLAGTNYEQAAELLKDQNVELQPSLEDAIEAARQLVS
jgi:succinyl-CoA synthetase beta subunit